MMGRVLPDILGRGGRLGIPVALAFLSAILFARLQRKQRNARTVQRVRAPR